MANDEAVKQTALNQEFNRAVVSLENSFKFMTTEVVNLAASLGKDLAPAASELIKDITSMIKGIRDFNEATGGAVTTSILMAVKVSALVIAVNKLKAVLLSTGIISAAMAAQLGTAATATLANSAASTIGSIKNLTFAGSFTAISTASKSALFAIKNFQVGLGAMIGGLIIAIDLGLKLGKVIGKLGELNSSEQDLANTQKQLNNLLAVRAKLQEKVNAGEAGAQERLDNINKEISQREGLISVIQREVNARAGGGIAPKGQDVPSVGIESPVDLGGDAVSSKESQKTAIVEENVALRIK